jgi:menaquinone-dependent protoporphyrinogen IX oxidase
MAVAVGKGVSVEDVVGLELGKSSTVVVGAGVWVGRYSISIRQPVNANSTAVKRIKEINFHSLNCIF